MAYQIVIVHKSKIAKVDEVVFGVRSDIENGVLASGSQMPSITVFARRIGISRDTVEKAYKRFKGGWLKFEYHYAKYISPDIRSKPKRWCEQFNYANHAMELLTKKKSKFIPVKEEDQI